MLIRFAWVAAVLGGAMLVVTLLAITVLRGPSETVVDVLDPVSVDPNLLAMVADVAGSVPVVGVMVILVAVASGSWRTGAVILAVAALAELLTAVIKGIVDRPRPSAAAAAEIIGSASFPSGHVVRTAIAVGLALVAVPWARRHPRASLGLGVAIVVTMAMGRVAAGAHHSSDVIAGMLVAAAILAAVALAGRIRPTRGHRWMFGPAAAALVALPLSVGAVRAASPTPPIGGDPRVPEGGASLIGEPVVAVVATLAVGLGAAIVTWVYVRLTPGRSTASPPGDEPTSPST